MVNKPAWIGLVLLALMLLGVGIGLRKAPSAPPPPVTTDPTTVTAYATEPIQPIPEPPLLDPLKVDLGERLFRDPRISRDGSIACTSCHIFGLALTDRQPQSRRVGGEQTEFNTPTLFNVTLNFRLFWNGRAKQLEEQIAHPRDTGTEWNNVLRKLKTDPELAPRFARAYPQGMTEATLQDAIVTFERSLITPNARFDRYLRGDKNAITREEEEGYYLFKSYGCASCHQGANVGGNMFQKLGVMRDFFKEHGPLDEADMGRYLITKQEQDRHVFRVPSLRNIALTAPYLHNGAAEDLRAVIAVMGKYQLGREIPPHDVERLIAFLHTLSGEYRGRALDQAPAR
ncbi:MAG: cytochrome B6 [Burkholderiales bacterium]|nr:cytochrome B6 [Burkholderiales bacterium]